MQKFYSWFSLVHDREKTIPVEEFGEHVHRMHADRDRWFELEYNVSLNRTLIVRLITLLYRPSINLPRQTIR